MINGGIFWLLPASPHVALREFWGAVLARHRKSLKVSIRKAVACARAAGCPGPSPHTADLAQPGCGRDALTPRENGLLRRVSGGRGFPVGVMGSLVAPRPASRVGLRAGSRADENRGPLGWPPPHFSFCQVRR